MLSQRSLQTPASTTAPISRLPISALPLPQSYPQTVCPASPANKILHPGQHPQNPAHLLQRQRLQEAHPTQSHAIQSRQSTSSPTSQRPPLLHPEPLPTLLSESSLIPPSPSRPQQSPKANAATTASNPATAAKPNPSSTKRPRPPRRSC